MPPFKTACIIGLGYIGLPTAALLASRKIKVVGADINQQVVDIINQGKIHIIEPELDMIVHATVNEGYLRASTKPEPSDVFIVAVPTPFTDNHEPDLSCIKAATKSIAPVLKKGDIVILESTSPVGTTELMAQWFAAERPDLHFPCGPDSGIDIHLAYCPERVLPGHVVRELVENDRIIGGLTPECSMKAKEIYRIFAEGELFETNSRTAEMCKLAENAFRDVNIAYANELSLICDKFGINAWELIKLANHHPRVNILQPGCGVGGHCIAVDPWFIINQAPQQSQLIRCAREINNHKPEWVLSKIKEATEQFTALQNGAKPIIAVLGLSFKPNIDDLRESPALFIAEKLYREHGKRLIVVDPYIETAPTSLKDCCLGTLEKALTEANIFIFLVKHKDFETLTYKTLRPEQQYIDAVGLFAERTTAIFDSPILKAVPTVE